MPSPLNPKGTIETRIDKARQRVAEQRAWIAHCGSTLDGYIARYGSKSAPDHLGDGGEDIFAADTAALDQAEVRLALLLTPAVRKMLDLLGHALGVVVEDTRIAGDLATLDPMALAQARDAFAAYRAVEVYPTPSGGDPLLDILDTAIADALDKETT